MSALRPLALAALLFAACSNGGGNTTPPTVDSGPSCTTDAGACEAGLVCEPTTGRCGPCKSSGQCAAHQLCEAGGTPRQLRCAFQAGFGNECVTNDACEAGKVCKQGLCIPSQEAVSCPNGLCGEGLRCNRTNSVCELDTGCDSDAQCDASQRCNTTTQRCEQRCTADNAAEVCLVGERCFSGRCAQCGSDGDCQGGLTCDVGAGRCTAGLTCFSDRDCDVPLVCNPLTSQCTVKPPPCVSDDQCRRDQICDVPNGRCALRGCQPDRYEPNHSQATASSVGPGTDFEVKSLTLCDGQQDFFAFALSQGDIVQVVVEADPLAAGSFTTTLLDPLGRAVARGDLVVSGQADSDGRYAVRIQSRDVQQKYALRFQIAKVAGSCENDGFEPNDTAAQATRLAPPGLDRLAICAGDNDWFALDVPADRGARLRVEHAAAAGDLELFVYTPDGTTLLGSSTTALDVEEVSIEASQAAGRRLLVRVAGASTRTENQYSLGAAFRLPGTDGGAP